MHYTKEILAVPDLPVVDGSFDFISCNTATSSIVRDVLGPVYGVKTINFSNIGGVKRLPVHDLREVLTSELGSRIKIGLKEWLDLARQAGMESEMVHIFEEFGEHVKSLVFPEVERSRDLV